MQKHMSPPAMRASSPLRPRAARIIRAACWRARRSAWPTREPCPEPTAGRVMRQAPMRGRQRPSHRTQAPSQERPTEAAMPMASREMAAPSSPITAVASSAPQAHRASALASTPGHPPRSITLAPSPRQCPADRAPPGVFTAPHPPALQTAAVLRSYREQPAAEAQASMPIPRRSPSTATPAPFTGPPFPAQPMASMAIWLARTSSSPATPTIFTGRAHRPSAQASSPIRRASRSLTTVARFQGRARPA